MVRVLHFVSIMNRAGQETFLMNLFRTIDREKVSFDFLCTLPECGDYDEEIRSLGGKICHIELSRQQSKFKHIDNFFRLYKYLHVLKDQYSFFHIHTHHALDAFRDVLAAKLAGIPNVIVHSHSMSAEYHRNAHMFFRGFLNHLGIYGLACSEEAGRWLFGEKGKFEIIRNGVNIEQYRFNAQKRDKIRIDNGWENDLVIGHVGRFAYPKNHAFIIEIYRKFLEICPESRLVFVGNGELMDEIKAMVDKYQLLDHVVFLGVRSDVDYFLQAFDVFLFPSRFEGLGISLIEAQCSGVSCVISDVIPKEVDVTECVYRLNLNENPDIWAEQVQKAAFDCKNRCRERIFEEVSAAGYSMVETAKRMLEIYYQKQF